VVSEPPTRLFFHIGAPKSGSTHLQHVLWANADRLREAGVCLPGENQRFHFDIGWAIRGKRQKDEHPPRYWVGSYETALSEIRESGCHTAVISDELFARASHRQVEKALERAGDLEVHLVYVVRDLAGLLPSFWQEEVKNGRSFPFDEWLERTREHVARDTFWRFHDVDDVIRRWAPDGTVPFHLIALPPAGSEDSLWDRFRRVLEIDTEVVSSNEAVNPSLGWTETELLRRVQERIPNARQARIVMKHFVSQNLLGTRTGTTPILIPEAHRDWIVRENAERIATFQQLPRTVGAASDLEIRDDRFGTPDPSDTEEQLDAAIDVLAGMAKRLAATRAEAEGSDGSGAAKRARLAISGVRDRLFPFGMD
jgi:hypothetical protein